jgi:hypothetical protein
MHGYLFSQLVISTWHGFSGVFDAQSSIACKLCVIWIPLEKQQTVVVIGTLLQKISCLYNFVKTLWYISIDEFGMLNYTCYLHLLILVSNNWEQGEVFLCIFTLLLLHLILHVSFKLPYKFLFSIFLKCFLRAVTDIFQVIMNEDIFPILHSKRIFYEVVLD